LNKKSNRLARQLKEKRRNRTIFAADIVGGTVVEMIIAVLADIKRPMALNLPHRPHTHGGKEKNTCLTDSGVV